MTARLLVNWERLDEKGAQFNDTAQRFRQHLMHGKCSKGTNLFEHFTFNDGTKLSTKGSCYNPNPSDAYNDIDDNLAGWMEKAIKDR